MQHTTLRPQSGPASINGDFRGKAIVSFDQFAVADLHQIFALAQQMKQLVRNNQPSRLLEGLLVTLLFFEPSSRTFASFAAAVKRLGGQTIELLNPQTASSVSKGESFEDTIQVM